MFGELFKIRNEGFEKKQISKSNYAKHIKEAYKNRMLEYKRSIS